MGTDSVTTRLMPDASLSYPEDEVLASLSYPEDEEVVASLSYVSSSESLSPW